VEVGMPQEPPLQEPSSELQPLMRTMPIPMQKVMPQEPRIRPMRWEQFIRLYPQELQFRQLEIQPIISTTGFGSVLPMGLMGFIIGWFLHLNYLRLLADFYLLLRLLGQLQNKNFTFFPFRLLLTIALFSMGGVTIVSPPPILMPPLEFAE